MSRNDTFAGGAGARYLLLGSALFLTMAGLVMIYSASSISDLVKHGDSAYHLKRQLQWIGLGTVLLVATMRIDYRRLRKGTWAFWGIAVLSLIAVLALGVVRGGARRWLVIAGMSLQPSELARIACVLVAAYLVAEYERGRITAKEFWSRLGGSLVVVCGLVVAQPDMGTTVSIVLAVVVVLFLAGLKWRYILGVVSAVAALAAVAIVAEPYRMARFTSFMDPWADAQNKGYQSVQALLALGTGGVDGVGLGLSRQKYFYLPEAHNDFIFAIIGEEIGLVGTLAVVIAFGVLAFAGVRIAIGAKDTFGRMIAGGLTGTLVLQAIMNMAAVTGLMPVTGKPMPLVSFGGSSMLVAMACVGLILSVSSYGARGSRPRAEARSGGDAGGVRKGAGQRRDVSVPNDGVREIRRASAHQRGRNGRSHLSGIDGGRATRRRA